MSTGRTMKFEHTNKLDSFLSQINKYLVDENHQTAVSYPFQYVSTWDGGKLAEKNEELLSKISGTANVYMLFTAVKGSSTYKLRYIGKTTQKLARPRLRNHLFKKNARTGAKLLSVMAHVKSGGSVMLSWITIEPESLRNWAEEELISLHPEADWNRENAKPGA